MPSVLETLKATGFTDEQIAALDPKLVTTFTTILNSADQTKTEAERKAAEAAAAAAKAEADRLAWEKAKADAELLQRANAEFYENSIVPGLTAAQEQQVKLQTEKANAEALAAFYRTQNEAARAAGFIPTDAPTFTPPVAVVPPTPVRGADGKFVTPGTPTYTIEDVRNQLGTDLGTVANIQWKYQSLYGKPMPISPTELLRQSEANKFKDPATYASQIFKFAEKEEEMRQAAAKAHDDEIAAKAAQAKEDEWKAKLAAREAEIAAEKKKIAEGQGNNPDVKLPPGSSKFAELRRQTEAKERPDPTRMTPQERRQTSLNNIHKALEEREQAVA